MMPVLERNIKYRWISSFSIDVNLVCKVQTKGNHIPEARDHSILSKARVSHLTTTYLLPSMV